MALLETLIVTIGGSIGKSLLNIWLKENPIADSLSSDMVTLITAKTNNVLAARKGAREFESIGDKVAASLEPVFRSHQFNIKHQQEIYELVASEVSAAISATNISTKLLASINYDPIKLAERMHRCRSTAKSQFNEHELALYNRAISMTAQHIVNIASDLPDYTKANFTEILLRLDSFQVQLDQIVDGLKRVFTTSLAANSNVRYADFETNYRASVIRSLDNLYLFGADVNRRIKRYRLTVAYVSLHVETDETHETGELNERVSIDTSLSKTDRSIVLGEAGSGKTTLLQWIAVSSASNNFGHELSEWQDTLPFFVRLRDFHDRLPSLEDIARSTCLEISDTMPTGWVNRIFRSGRAILLLDGVDEVPQNERESLYRWVYSILEQHPNTRLIVSMRPTSYDEWWVHDCCCEEQFLEPMQIPDIELFVSYWHNAVLVEQELESKDHVQIIINRLIDRIKSNLPLKQLATNPLLSAMICALHYERNMQLPSDRNALYEACCSMLLERRDPERGIQLGQTHELSYRQKRILLDDLAYWMMKNEYSSVSLREAILRVKPRISNMIQSDDHQVTKNILSQMIERSGIIREPSPGELDFLHRTFQEYMAASAAATEVDWGFLVEKASNDLWHETIILAAGFANQKQADDLIASLLKKAQDGPEDSTRINLLAISCLETANEISSKTREKVNELLRELIPPQDAGQEKQIAAAGSLAVSYLARTEKLSQKDAATCVRILQLIGTPEALSVMGSYCADQREGVRKSIDSALHYITPQECYESGLSKEIQSSLKHFVHKGKMEVKGIILHALSSVPLDSFLTFSVCNAVHSIAVNDFWPSGILVLNMFPSILSLLLSGDLGFEGELNLKAKIELLDLRNTNSKWPNFWRDPSLQSIKSLRLMYTPESDFGSVYNWPDFYDVAKLENLVKLEVFSDYSDDLPEIKDLAQIRQLEHLHMATAFGDIPDIQPLHDLKNLKILEMSLRANSLKDGLTGFEELTHIENLVINLDEHPVHESVTHDVLVGLRNDIALYLPNCRISFSGGWNSKNW